MQSDNSPTKPSDSLSTLGRKFILSLISIKWMEHSIRRAAPTNAPAGALQIFDTRFGYTVGEAKQTLQSWGTRGRIIYLLIEAIDCIGFISAYREILQRLYAKFIINPQEMNLSWVILLLVYVDYVENAGQAMMTLAFENGLGEADWFPALVQISSTANIVKWNVAKYGAFLLLSLYLFKKLAFVSGLLRK